MELEVFSQSGQSLQSPQQLATEGTALRNDLNGWQRRQSHRTEFKMSAETSALIDNDHIILARIFFAAISIYLSGIFDYHLWYWATLDVALPVLTRSEVSIYYTETVELVRLALNRGSLSPVLLLFPLRVAGARAQDDQQRSVVVELLHEVGKQYAVAGQFIADLEGMWS